MKNTNRIVTIYGGTGDLTYRKLLPAFYNLFVTDSLPEKFQIVVVGRQDMTPHSYRELITPWLEVHARLNVNASHLNKFLELVTYFKMSFTDDEGYPRLEALYQSMMDEPEHLYYFAVAPSFFESIALKLDKHGMTHDRSVIIEKPFGSDLASALQINETLTKIFTEKNIYRIDHYVAKEMVQNIFTIRFANMLFSNIWNHNSINNIQISASETVGVENRGGYYDHTGALKDMFQNHLLQILSIITMDKPESLVAEHIHPKQEEILESLYIDSMEDDVVFGQYTQNKDSKGYLEEDKVNENSHTETFVALKLHSKLPQWKDTPFYIRTGKRMHKRATEVMVEFNQKDHEKPNVLIIKIQPDEGVYLRFNIKKPGKTHEIQTVFMDFCQSCNYANRENTPEAYERLLNAAMNHDHSLFASFKQVMLSWEFVEKILNERTNKAPEAYAAYTSGPVGSHELLERDGHLWIEEEVMGDIYQY